MSNNIDEKIFEQIFGHTFETLANKLINTINKEENQIIVDNIEKNKKNFSKKMMIISDLRNNLIDTVTLILGFNETIQLDLV